MGKLCSRIGLAAVFSLAVLFVPCEASANKAAARAFSRGVKLFENGDYVGAVQAFEKAYRIKPHPIVRCNIARSYERLADMVNAAKNFKRCLKEGAGGKQAQRARDALRRVQARIARIEVRSATMGTLYVAGDRIGKTPQTIWLNPGTHVLEVRRSGATPARRKLTVRGGERRTLSLTPVDLKAVEEVKPGDKPIGKLDPDPDPKPGERDGLHPAWFWTGVGLTAVLTVVSAVLGSQAVSAKNEYEDLAAQFQQDRLNSTYDAAVVKIGNAKNKRTITNVLWGLTAAVGVATGVTFFYTDFGGGSSSKESDAALRSPRRNMAFGVQVGGRF